jgi:hypothetical protein
MHVSLCLALLLSTPAADQPLGLGNLWLPTEKGYCLDRPYTPQEGDLVFFSGVSPLYVIAYGVARSGHPWHVGMVIRRTSGELALFESGSPDYRGVAIETLTDRLICYIDHPQRRRIWVRQIRMPLTPEQSRCLTLFAEAQDGKPFTSYLRLGLLGVPCRPLRPTETDQCRWFCAEIVVEAMRLVGLRSACGLQPEKTLPRDLFTDKVDISCGWHCPATWSKGCCPPRCGPPCAPP